ncbi:MAG: NUDIX domain-containing protein [Lysobacter sp.]|nr:NUDIX domain-containing protein [Lysobacter sp.]
MPERSAGVLLHRRGNAGIEVLLGHPGGPYWRHRDLGAWTIPKGGIAPGEEAEDAARREFEEETGCAAHGPLQPLGGIRQRGGKWVEAYALAGDFDPRALRSIAFEMEWPARSGRIASFPELDHDAWFTLDAARVRILAGQAPLLDRLAALLA